MITKEQCQRRALLLRVEAYNILDRRLRLVGPPGVRDDEYPDWVRELDDQAGRKFDEAYRLIKLARGPFWKRWFR